MNGFSAADMSTAAANGFRDGLAAQPAAAPAEMSPEFTDTARAAIAWVLWHHLGGSSPVGQPLRFALGMGDHDPLPDWRIAEAKRYAEWAGATTAKFHEARASTPAAPGIDLRAVVSEYIAARDTHELATRPLNSHAPVRQLRYGSPILRRWADAREALRLAMSDASPKGDETDQIGDLVEGMTVSIDVDRMFNTDGRRLFGTVTGVQHDGDEKCGLTLFVQDAEPNWDDSTGVEPKIWGTQIPGSMPKLFGARHITELNWYPDEGYDLVCMQVTERLQATSAEVGS